MPVRHQRAQRQRQGNQAHQTSVSLVNTTGDPSEGEEEGIESGKNVSEGGEGGEETSKKMSEVGKEREEDREVCQRKGREQMRR